MIFMSLQNISGLPWLAACVDLHAHLFPQTREFPVESFVCPPQTTNRWGKMIWTYLLNTGKSWPPNHLCESGLQFLDLCLDVSLASWRRGVVAWRHGGSRWSSLGLLSNSSNKKWQINDWWKNDGSTLQESTLFTILSYIELRCAGLLLRKGPAICIWQNGQIRKSGKV